MPSACVSQCHKCIKTQIDKITPKCVWSWGIQDNVHIQQYTHKWYIKYCVCISMLAVCHPEGHLLVLISPARVDSSMLCKASTRVAQFTGCLPLPVSHSLRIPMFICMHRIVQTFVCHNLDSWSISVLQEGNAKTDILGCYFYRNADHPSISTCELQQFW